MAEDKFKSEKSEPMKKKVKKRLLDWCMSVTSHGIPRIIEADKIYIKLMWLCCLLVSMSLCAFMVTRSIQNYLAFEVTTTIRVKALKEIDLPVITICNMNDFVKKEALDFMKDMWYDPENFNLLKYFDEQYRNVSIPTINDEYWLFSMMSHPYFNETIKKSFSYWPDGFISCQYQRYMTIFECDSFYNWFYHPWYGNCFKFNSGFDHLGNKTDLIKVVREGDGFGVELFVNPSDLYVNYDFADVSNGLYVSIDHQESRYFYPDFFTVKPGSNVRVKLSKVITETLPPPHGDCVRPETFDNLFSRELRKLGFNYTRKNCMRVCMQKDIIDHYGCYNLFLPKILNAQPCTNITWYTFSYPDECLDNCPTECSSIRYDLTISTSEYPSNSQVNIIKRDQYDFLTDVYGTDQITDDMIKNSYSRIFVYYDDIKETHISESESITFVDFIANLGGTLGLFIGTSVLSFVEIFELMLNLIQILFENRFKHPKNSI